MNAAALADQNARIVCKLSIERCRHHLSHLHAIMHMCKPHDLGMDDVSAESARKLLELMDQELSSSSDVLEVHR